MSLSFSPSGRMLLTTSEDMTAFIWNVPSGNTWPKAPHVTFKGHPDYVCGGTFLGSDANVITASFEGSIRIWRSVDGVQTANYHSLWVGHLFAYFY